MALIKIFVTNIRRSPMDGFRFLVTVFILSAAALTFIAKFIRINNL